MQELFTLVKALLLGDSAGLLTGPDLFGRGQAPFLLPPLVLGGGGEREEHLPMISWGEPAAPTVEQCSAVGVLSIMAPQGLWQGQARAESAQGQR
jgi:hypothetical protein